jgi:uncharacterized radical SAM superfamily Fe-S cluster-containing enzyme
MPALALPSRGQSTHTYFSATRSLCRICRQTVEAKVLFRDGAVYFDKFCPSHGKQEALVSSSVEWYLDALSFLGRATPPVPLKPVSEAGCPFDCGPCSSHQQRTFLPVVPITSACNLDCPICYTINRNRDPYNISTDEMRRLLDRLTAHPEGLDIINFTGGEPTLHPELPELLRMSRDAGIRRLTVSTNGLKLLDEEYVKKLASLDARIVLSFDTFRPSTDRSLVGADTVALKLHVLDLLQKHDVATTILPAVARGFNDDETGKLLDLVLTRPNILSLEMHTLAFTGQGAVGFSRQGRITIPDLHRQLDLATGGRITTMDFVPSPLAHPHCYSICYLLCLGGGDFVPLTRLLSREKLFGLLGPSLYLEPREELEEVFREMIDALWADPGVIPQSERALATIKRLISDLYPEGPQKPSARERQKIAERSVKAIYIHSHMDEETFDVSRIMKCCVAVPEEDGTSIPTCSYNVLYREKDPRFTDGHRVAGMKAAREGRS